MLVEHTFDWSTEFTIFWWHTAKYPQPTERTAHLSDQQSFLRVERSEVKCSIMEAMDREEEIIEGELESEEEWQQERTGV